MATGVVALIPARYASTRLPGKPLLDIAGKTMIQRVYERAAASGLVDEVIVATDDGRIAEAVSGFGGRVELTRPDHTTGTDRLAEVAAGLDCDVVVNVQGDEPLIDPAAIDLALRPLLDSAELVMTTLCEPIISTADCDNPNVVKVVRDSAGYALYFSRAPIPYPRASDPASPCWRHVGLYAYRRDFLLHYAQLKPTPLQVTESLEQLRALEHGYRILCVECPYPSQGVDTPEDLERVRALLATGS